MTKEDPVPTPARMREFNKLSLVHRVYYACKDGFARLLLATLKDISCEHDRKAIVDQVRGIDNLCRFFARAVREES